MADIRAIVEGLTEEYKTRDPFELCGHLEIEVLKAVLPTRVSGFYTELMGLPFIYLNQSLSEERERAVCAHELGHAVLHPKCNSLFLGKSTNFVTGKFEREANLFAGFLLLDPALRELCRREGWTTAQLGVYLSLPEETVAYCAARLWDWDKAEGFQNSVHF